VCEGREIGVGKSRKEEENLMDEGKKVLKVGGDGQWVPSG
jgi:hypothetical protein